MTPSDLRALKERTGFAASANSMLEDWGLVALCAWVLFGLLLVMRWAFPKRRRRA